MRGKGGSRFANSFARASYRIHTPGMTKPESDRAKASRDAPRDPAEPTEEVVLLEDLVPRADVRGGRKIVLGEDTPSAPRDLSL